MGKIAEWATNPFSAFLFMGKRLVFLVITALAAGMSQAKEYEDIVIVRSDEKGIVFQYRPENVRLEAAEAFDSTAGGKELQRLAIGRCARTVAKGNYDLPVRIVLLGIPVDARPEVSAFSTGEDRIAAAHASLNGKAAGKKEMVAAANYALDEEKTGMDHDVIPERPFWIGNQRVLRLKLFPARYDEAARQYRVAERVEVEVHFNSSETVAATNLPTPWEKVLRNGLANYEQAKAFRVRSEQSGKLAKPVAFSSPFGQSQNWLKITFSENGIYRIDRNMLAAVGVPVSTIDPHTLRMFCQGGRAVPVFNDVPRPAWQELAIEVTGEQDGRLDAGDEIHFYGWSVNGWDYDSTSGTFSFAKDNYTTSQVFWLTWGGSFPGPALRVGQTSVAPAGAPPVAGFPARIHFEQDRFLAVDNGGEINDYFNWYGGKGMVQTYYLNLPQLTAGAETVTVKHLSAGVSLTVNLVPATPVSSVTGLATFATSALKTGLNRFDLSVITNFQGYDDFDYLEAGYTRAPVYSSPLTELETPAGSGMVEFQVSGSPADFVLWNVSNRFSPVSDTGAVRSGSGVLSFDVDASRKKLMILTSTADFKRPSLSVAPTVDLTAPDQGEFILIAPAAFRPALAGYASHRALKSGLNVKQIDVEQIYNNFSGGLPDPAAIRDFLKFARQNWSDPKPRFALLVGDGTYDFRNILGTGTPNYVPPFIVDQAFDASSNSDEGFLYFGTPGILDTADQFLDMSIGRWPVNNGSELQAVADKITKYESSPEFGTWRNQVTIVADDEYGIFDTEGFHTQRAESLSNQLPRRFDQDKIYLMDYPFDGLRNKPGAEDAIVRSWNEGSLAIDYIGHGNPDVWAHEHVFRRSEDIPRLVNGHRLPLVYAASCNINAFIDPTSDGMGEDLLKDPVGGALAVIAAVRLVFAGPNNDLNEKVFNLLFGSDTLSVGEAFYLAKLLRQYATSPPTPITNDRRYVLFGDPAEFLARPSYGIRVSAPDTLAALAVATVSGAVVETAGDTLKGFNGTAELSVFDGTRFKSHPLGGAPDIRVDYQLPGSPVYRGTVPVAAGRFQFLFVVPKDISYGSITGRLSAYAWNTSGDALGYKDSIVYSGSATASNDTTGPKIEIVSEGGASVKPGDPVAAGTALGVRVEDSSGINILDEPAHQLTASFDYPAGPSFDLTGSFRYDPGSFAQGQAGLTVPALRSGRHALRIKAWDGANNSAVLEMSLEIVSSDKLKLSDVLNYPNPMKDKTSFCYILSAPADEVAIEIYTLAGRLVKTIRSAASHGGYNFETTWDGRDNDGDRVASGVYLYKVRARLAARETAEFGKIVLMR